MRSPKISEKGSEISFKNGEGSQKKGDSVKMGE